MIRTRETSDRTKTDSSPTSEDISFYLYRVYYKFLALLESMLSDTGLDAKGVRPGMGQVLFALYERDNCTIKDIVRKTHLSPSTLTGTLARMQKARIVRLQPCPKDQRAMRITLTPHGRSLQPQLHDLHERIMTVLKSETDEKALAQARNTMGLMLSAMQNYQNNQRYKE